MPIGKPRTGYWSNTGWVEGGNSANDPSYSALTNSGATSSNNFINTPTPTPVPPPTGATIATPSSTTPGTNTGMSYTATPGTTNTSFYGATARNANLEGNSLREEQGIASAAGSSGIINQNFLSTITSDSSIVGFYINALAYGGYTAGDILNDMKRRELAASGNLDAANLKVIDPEQNRSTYMSSTEGQQATIATQKLIPTSSLQGFTNPEILKYGSNMPDDLFKILSPISDQNSQEFKDAVASVKASFFDAASASLQATTEQDKAIADANYAQVKSDIEKKYGIVLSADATKAWTQINSLGDSFNTRGIAGSGMQTQAVDQSLQTIRNTDQQNRDVKLSDQESQKKAYYQSSATSAEIAALTPEDRQKYGLTPSADIAQQFSIANLTAKYPDLSPELIKAKHDAMIDENGNYRSSIYKNYYSGLSANMATEDTNAKNQVITDANNKDIKAYNQYDTNNALNIQPPVGGKTTPVGKTDSGLSAAGNQAGAISNAISNPPASTPPSNGNTSGSWTNGAIDPKTNTVGTGTWVPAPSGTSTPKSLAPSNPIIGPTKPTSTGYQGGSIVDYLSSLGKDSSYTGRTTLASQYGITNYTGSADQNTQLLSKLRGA